MFATFYATYAATFNTDCTMSESALIHALQEHPQYGAEFKTASQFNYNTLIMKHLPDLLEYVHDLLVKAAEVQWCEDLALEKFRDAYFQKYGEHLVGNDASLRQMLGSHPMLGKEFCDSHGADLSAFMNYHGSDLLTYVHASTPGTASNIVSTFKAVYHDAYGEDCGMSDEELLTALCGASHILASVKNDSKEARKYIAQHMSELVEHIWQGLGPSKYDIVRYAYQRMYQEKLTMTDDQLWDALCSQHAWGSTLALYKENLTVAREFLDYHMDDFILHIKLMQM